MTKDEIDKKAQLVAEKAEIYKKDFEGLSKKHQKLLAYRKIIELAQNNKSTEYTLENSKDNVVLELNDEIKAIMEASDYNCGLIGPLVLNSMQNRAKDIKELYKKSLDSYTKVLENYKLLAKELNIHNSLELSHLFTYMLWNGYYSVNKTHCYKLKGRLLLSTMNSFDVIRGQGVCLAYAQLLHDYLTTCDKKSSLMTCKVPTRKKTVSCNYRPEIERTIENNFGSILSSKIGMIFFRWLINKIGNHAVTLAEENDKLFVYDPTNIFVLNVTGENKASIINGKGDFELKPFSSLIFQPDSDPNKLFEKLLFDSIEPAFTRQEIIFSFENIMELLNNNIKLLDDAYDNIHSELEVINKQTNEIGGNFKALKKMKK